MSGLPVLGLVATITVLCGTLGHTTENDFNSAVQNGGAQVKSSSEQCHSGLFVTKKEMKVMRRSCDGVFFPTLFKLTRYEKQFEFSPRCGDYDRVQSPVQGFCMSNCSRDAQIQVQPAQQMRRLRMLSKRSSRSICAACCTTTMSVSIPWTVTDLYSRKEYTVKHMASSYQLLNLGHCAGSGAACGLGGTCDQTYRIHWVLVTSASGDTFVPASVPNHCTCVYS